ncbi:helix-turn-helix domain-containing protein [Sorangium sp. So ce854]|uniref:helix-turn-helix domain-containing protein n=1 Tax=Sorangium sp. So ce854 TaxID=3133322 RepID=UPI003F64595B
MIRLIAEGHAIKEIAARLDLSARTVENTRSGPWRSSASRAARTRSATPCSRAGSRASSARAPRPPAAGATERSRRGAAASGAPTPRPASPASPAGSSPPRS